MKKYISPELLFNQLTTIDVMTASGEETSSVNDNQEVAANSIYNLI